MVQSAANIYSSGFVWYVTSTDTKAWRRHFQLESCTTVIPLHRPTGDTQYISLSFRSDLILPANKTSQKGD